MTEKHVSDEARAEAAAARLVAAGAAFTWTVLAQVNQSAGRVIPAGTTAPVIDATPSLPAKGTFLVLFSSSGASGAGLTSMSLNLEVSIDGGLFGNIQDVQCSGGAASEKIAGSSFVATGVGRTGGSAAVFRVTASPVGGSYTTGTGLEGSLVVIQLP